MNYPGMLLIISGPSGVGKTTITREVIRHFGGRFSVSMTTRPQAATDTDGVDYKFVDQATFDRAREAGELLEWAEVFGNCYGTPRPPVVEALEKGELILLEIDVDGAEQVKRSLPETFAVFILPPSEDTLLQRLRDRKREDEQAIQRRFAKARAEMARAKGNGVYDAFVVNDDLQEAIAETFEQVSTALAERRGG